MSDQVINCILTLCNSHLKWILFGEKLWDVILQKWKDGNETHASSGLGIGSLITLNEVKIETQCSKGTYTIIKWKISHN